MASAKANLYAKFCSYSSWTKAILCGKTSSFHDGSAKHFSRDALEHENAK